MEKEVLKKVAKLLNSTGCTWAVGSSVLLSFHNLIAEPKDIDILIDPKDADKIRDAMSKIGIKIPLVSRYPYLTKEFFGYKVDNTEVEFMGDFSIALENDGIYEFVLDSKAIIGVEDVEGIKVNITSLEDWIVAYMVMNDPKNRVPLIKDYFENMGIEHRELLERNLERHLPERVKDIVKDLLDIV